jgi:hypothetical protein
VRDDESDTVSVPGVEVVRSRAVVSSIRDIEAVLVAEGLTPHSWANGAGVIYGRHTHAFHKVLFCVSGAVVFHTAAGDVELGPGDRMDLAAGVEHGATVGDNGVTCVEAPRP